MPEELKGLTGPIIGYVGALVSFRLNINMLEKLVSKRRDWNWVFVGPEDNEFMASELHKYPNAFFLGRKNEKELASYVSFFDVCINPQLVNEITIGNYPRKVDEYLAMGKPVVATYTEFMKGFLPWVRLCKNNQEYELAIEESIEETNNIVLKEMRQDFALMHTWESSVNKIYDLYKN
jgi:glycosyltransferase involved in cell wall biosynthesis